MRSRTLLIILLIALAVRVGLLATVWRHPGERIYTPDSQAYIELAGSLVEHGTFQRDGQVEIFRTPGYPLLLSAASICKGSWWRAVLVGQVLLDVAGVYLTFLLGWMLVGPRTGLVAAFLAALEPLAVAASLRVLSDSVYAFLFTLAVLLAVHHIRSRRTWALIAAAVVLGAACYVRPAGLAMAVVVAVVLLIVGGKRRWVRAAVFVGIVIVAAAPWVVRNAVVADYWGFSSFATDAMYYFAAPQVVAEADGIPPAVVRAQMKVSDSVANAGATPGAAAAARWDEAMEIISSHPWLYARIHLAGSVGVFLPAATDVLQTAGITRGEQGTVDVLHTRGLIAAVRHYFRDNPGAMVLAGLLMVVTAVQYAGALVCVARGLTRRVPAEAWLLAAIVVVTVLLPGPFGLPRYRLPITPILCAAAGVGLVRMTKSKSAKAEK